VNANARNVLEIEETKEIECEIGPGKWVYEFLNYSSQILNSKVFKLFYFKLLSQNYSTGCIKKLNRFEIAFNFAKQLLASSFWCTI
jgi:hypothetical protein